MRRARVGNWQRRWTPKGSACPSKPPTRISGRRSEGSHLRHGPGQALDMAPPVASRATLVHGLLGPGVLSLASDGASHPEDIENLPRGLQSSVAPGTCSSCEGVGRLARWDWRWHGAKAPFAIRASTNDPECAAVATSTACRGTCHKALADRSTWGALFSPARHTTRAS